MHWNKNAQGQPFYTSHEVGFRESLFRISAISISYNCKSNPMHASKCKYQKKKKKSHFLPNYIKLKTYIINQSTGCDMALNYKYCPPKTVS